MKTLSKAIYSLLLLLGAFTGAHAQLYTANSNGIEAYDTTTGFAVDSTYALGGDHATTTYLDAGNDALYVVNQSGTQNGTGDTITISSYIPSTLAVINSDVATFTAVQDSNGNDGNVSSMVISGNTLYISNDAYYNTEIDTVDLTTGATNTLLTANDSLEGIIVNGNTLYASTYGSGVVETFDATTGAPINPVFIGLENSVGAGTGGYMVTAGNDLYVDDWTNNTVGVYNLTTGATVNEFFITSGAETGYSTPGPLAISGDNLFVSYTDNSTYEYNATTGLLEAEFAGVNTPDDFSAQDEPGFVPPPQVSEPGSTPEPKSWLFASGVLCVVALLRSKPKMLSLDLPDLA